MSLREWWGDVSSLVLSLVLAVMVWLVALQASAPMEERVVPSAAAPPLPIQFERVPEGQAVFGEDAEVARVEIRGVAADLDTIQPDALRVVADLSKATGQGVITVPLTAHCTDCGRKAVRVLSVLPPQVTLRLAPAASAQWPVEAQLSDIALQVCRGIEAQSVPAKVTVAGAVNRVERVHRVVARLEADSSQTHIAAPSTIVEALDVRGAQIDDVTISPPTVGMTVDLVVVEGCAEAFVSPFYTDPPEGYYVGDINVAPERVELRGPAELLAQFRDDPVVLTHRVDLSDARAPVTRLVDLDLPAGVTTVNSLDGVTVTIRVIPVPGTRTVDLPVEPVNLPAGLEVESINAPRVQFLLSGPQADLMALDPDALRATLDLAGQGAGPVRVAPQVEVPAGIVVRAVTPAEVDVRLRPLAP